jgi:transposase
LVREFVRKRRQKYQKVTAKEVTNLLLQKGLIQVEKDELGVYDSRQLASAGRAVRRFLVRHGYRRGRRKATLVPNPEHEHKRDVFLQTLIENRSKPPNERLREVYLDESYIHHHYKWKPTEDLYDPNDPEDVVFGKEKHKGDRYCFLCAIQGPSPQQRGLPDDAGGVVPLSWWHFSPSRKEDHRGDYHKVFKAENFIPWFEQFIDRLNEPSLIIMDNATYHLAYRKEVPKVYKMNKLPLQEYLQNVGVEYSATDTVPMLQRKARKYIEDHETPECIRLAENRGHTILWTAPGYSDLQPIELLWALVKGRVGRQYDDQTKKSMVEERLLREVEQLDTPGGIQSILRMIESCYKRSYKIWQEIQQAEERPADQADNSESDGEGSNLLDSDLEDLDEIDIVDGGEDKEDVDGLGVAV